MELNFDKEMDALLRQTAHREKIAPPAEAHLDTDELSAFVAGALPVKARSRAMEHLVDCGNCRTILSDLVFFENQAEEVALTHSAVASSTPGTESATLLDRIRAFFTLPMLVYGTASVVLIFAAAFTFIVVRNNSGSQIAQLDTQAMNKPAPAKAASSDAGETFNNSPAQMASNSAANAPSTASVANTATGGAFAAPPPSSLAESANPKSVFNEGPVDKEKSPVKLADEAETKKDIVVDGVLKAAEPKPAPAVAKPEESQTKTQALDQVVRGQENQRSNSNIMMPDGGANRRSTAAEAGANLSREADRDDRAKDDKNKQAAPPPPPAGRAVTEKGVKKTRKKEAAAPAPTPTPSPKKEKPEDELPPASENPCRQ